MIQMTEETHAELLAQLYEILALVEKQEKEAIEVKAKYQELILSVGKKYEGETRHETARRYILQAEQQPQQTAGVKRCPDLK